MCVSNILCDLHQIDTDVAPVLIQSKTNGIERSNQLRANKQWLEVDSIYKRRKEKEPTASIVLSLVWLNETAVHRVLLLFFLFMCCLIRKISHIYFIHFGVWYFRMCESFWTRFFLLSLLLFCYGIKKNE